MEMVFVTNMARTKVMDIAEVESQATKKRSVKLKYGNWELTAEVGSIEEEIECHMRTHVRSWAVSLGLFPALAGEREVTTYEKILVEEMEKSVYSKARTAREFAATLLKGETKIDGEKVKDDFFFFGGGGALQVRGWVQKMPAFARTFWFLWVGGVFLET